MVEYQKELGRAVQARERGNEGMARVCARRAAGIVVGEYLNRRGYRGLNNSAYDRLSVFSSLPDVDEEYQQVCRHFIVKVNQEHNLPADSDLIEEAAWLREKLLNDNQD